MLQKIFTTTVCCVAVGALLNVYAADKNPLLPYKKQPAILAIRDKNLFEINELLQFVELGIPLIKADGDDVRSWLPSLSVLGSSESWAIINYKGKVLQCGDGDTPEDVIKKIININPNSEIKILSDFCRKHPDNGEALGSLAIAELRRSGRAASSRELIGLNTYSEQIDRRIWGSTTLVVEELFKKNAWSKNMAIWILLIPESAKKSNIFKKCLEDNIKTIEDHLIAYPSDEPVWNLWSLCVQMGLSDVEKLLDFIKPHPGDTRWPNLTALKYIIKVHRDSKIYNGMINDLNKVIDFKMSNPPISMSGSEDSVAQDLWTELLEAYVDACIKSKRPDMADKKLLEVSSWLPSNKAYVFNMASGLARKLEEMTYSDIWKKNAETVTSIKSKNIISKLSQIRKHDGALVFLNASIQFASGNQAWLELSPYVINLDRQKDQSILNQFVGIGENDAWLYVDNKFRVIVSGTERRSDIIANKLKAAGIKSKIDALKAFCESHPNHIAAKEAMISSLFERSSKLTQATLGTKVDSHAMLPEVLDDLIWRDTAIAVERFIESGDWMLGGIVWGTKIPKNCMRSNILKKAFVRQVDCVENHLLSYVNDYPAWKLLESIYGCIGQNEARFLQKIMPHPMMKTWPNPVYLKIVIQNHRKHNRYNELKLLLSGLWEDKRIEYFDKYNMPDYDEAAIEWELMLEPLVEMAFLTDDPSLAQRVVSEACEVYGSSKALLAGAVRLAEVHKNSSLAFRWGQLMNKR